MAYRISGHLFYPFTTAAILNVVLYRRCGYLWFTACVLLPYYAFDAAVTLRFITDFRCYPKACSARITFYLPYRYTAR